MHGDLLDILSRTESEMVISEKYNSIDFSDGDVVNVSLQNIGILKSGFAILKDVGGNSFRFISTSAINHTAAKLKALMEYKEAKVNTLTLIDKKQFDYINLSEEQRMVLAQTLESLGLGSLHGVDAVSISTYGSEVKGSDEGITVNDLETAFSVEESDKHVWYILFDNPKDPRKIIAYNLSDLYHHKFITINDIMIELYDQMHLERKLQMMQYHPEDYVQETRSSQPSASERDSKLTDFLSGVLANHNPKIKFTKRGMKNVKTDHRRRHRRM